MCESLKHVLLFSDLDWAYECCEKNTDVSTSFLLFYHLEFCVHVRMHLYFLEYSNEHWLCTFSHNNWFPLSGDLSLECIHYFEFNFNIISRYILLVLSGVLQRTRGIGIYRYHCFINFYLLYDSNLIFNVSINISVVGYWIK